MRSDLPVLIIMHAKVMQDSHILEITALANGVGVEILDSFAAGNDSAFTASWLECHP